MDAASTREYETLCTRLAALDAQRGFIVARMKELRTSDPAAAFELFILLVESTMQELRASAPVDRLDLGADLRA